MARALVDIKICDQGPSILVESTASEGAPAFIDAAAGGDVLLKAEKTLTAAFSSFAPVVDTILSQLKAVVQRPKTAVLELGIKFGAKGNIIIAGGEAEANCKITLTWDIPVSDAGPALQPDTCVSAEFTRSENTTPSHAATKIDQTAPSQSPYTPANQGMERSSQDQ